MVVLAYMAKLLHQSVCLVWLPITIPQPTHLRIKPTMLNYRFSNIQTATTASLTLNPPLAVMYLPRPIRQLTSLG
jgi:hypothetical protein